MTVLRIEFMGGTQVLSCESCNWTGPQTGMKCKNCGERFDKVRLIAQDGREVGALVDPPPPENN